MLDRDKFLYNRLRELSSSHGYYHECDKILLNDPELKEQDNIDYINKEHYKVYGLTYYNTSLLKSLCSDDDKRISLILSKLLDLGYEHIYEFNDSYNRVDNFVCRSKLSKMHEKRELCLKYGEDYSKNSDIMDDYTLDLCKMCIDKYGWSYVMNKNEFEEKYNNLREHPYEFYVDKKFYEILFYSIYSKNDNKYSHRLNPLLTADIFDLRLIKHVNLDKLLKLNRVGNGLLLKLCDTWPNFFDWEYVLKNPNKNIVIKLEHMVKVKYNMKSNEIILYINNKPYYKLVFNDKPGIYFYGKHNYFIDNKELLDAHNLLMNTLCGTYNKVKNLDALQVRELFVRYAAEHADQLVEEKFPGEDKENKEDHYE